jgi:branched-chain amino acid transport system substrate-binding protein
MKKYAPALGYSLSWLTIVAVFLMVSPHLVQGQDDDDFEFENRKNVIDDSRVYTGPRFPGGITDEEILIGTWSPQSGSAAPWGAVARGMGDFFQMITAGGGINGRRIRLLMVDDKNSPDLTLAGVKTLSLDYGVFAFAGGVGAENSLAANDFLASRQIPWIGPATGLTSLADENHPRVFTVMPSDSSQAAALVRYAVRNMGLSRLAMVYQDDAFGRGGLAGVKTQTAAAGASLVAALPTDRAASNLAEHVNTLKDATPQAIIVWLPPASAIVLRNLAKQKELDAVWMTGCALSDALVMGKLTNGLWTGTIFTACVEPPDSKDPLMAQYKAAHHRFSLPGETWSPFYYHGFGLAEPLVEALFRCGPDPVREKLVEELQNMTAFKGIMGKISFSPEHHRGGRQLYLAQALERGNVRVLSDWFNAP